MSVELGCNNSTKWQSPRNNSKLVVPGKYPELQDGGGRVVEGVVGGRGVVIGVGGGGSSEGVGTGTSQKVNGLSCNNFEVKSNKYINKPSHFKAVNGGEFGVPRGVSNIYTQHETTPSSGRRKLGPGKSV